MSKNPTSKNPKKKTIPNLSLLTSEHWEDYELVDSGNGNKLERFGNYLLIRPEAEAIWQPSLPKSEWDKAHAVFVVTSEKNGGHWESKKELPARWIIEYKGLRFWLQLSGSKQIGVFPEQANHWDFIHHLITGTKRPLKVLNLFGYTGVASLAAARAGAEVTHVDASKKAIYWAKENQQLSGLAERPIRWLVDDVLKFVAREERRNSFYDGIILDPPKFGRGPKGEVWEFYKLLPSLLQQCKQILSPKPEFIVLTAYSVKASPFTLHQITEELMKGKKGQTSAGEIVLVENNAGRVLSTAIFARWEASKPKKP